MCGLLDRDEAETNSCGPFVFLRESHCSDINGPGWPRTPSSKCAFCMTARKQSVEVLKTKVVQIAPSATKLRVSLCNSRKKLVHKGHRTRTGSCPLPNCVRVNLDKCLCLLPGSTTVTLEIKLILSSATAWPTNAECIALLSVGC